MPSTWPELHSGTNFNYIWDVPTLAWIKMTAAGGGGGGAATIADGADTAEGTTTDPVWTSGAGTTIGLLKSLASSYIFLADYDGSGNLLYLALAAPGTASSAAGWWIRKFAVSGTNIVSGLSANGSLVFNQIYDNRVGLSYS